MSLHFFRGVITSVKPIYFQAIYFGTYHNHNPLWTNQWSSGFHQGRPWPSPTCLGAHHLAMPRWAHHLLLPNGSEKRGGLVVGKMAKKNGELEFPIGTMAKKMVKNWLNPIVHPMKKNARPHHVGWLAENDGTWENPSKSSGEFYPFPDLSDSS